MSVDLYVKKTKYQRKKITKDLVWLINSYAVLDFEGISLMEQISGSDLILGKSRKNKISYQLIFHKLADALPAFVTTN